MLMRNINDLKNNFIFFEMSRRSVARANISHDKISIVMKKRDIMKNDYYS